MCNRVYAFAFPVRHADGIDRSRARLARRAQPSQAADQGRHPLQPRGRRGGGEGARGADDLQVRDRRRAVRRRQGRRARSSPTRYTVEELERITRRYTHELDRKKDSSAPASTCRRPTTAPASARWRGSSTPTAQLHPGELDALALRDRQAGHRRAASAGAGGHRPRPVSSRCAKRADRPTTCSALGLSLGLDGKRVVVQGLGNVGYHAAKFCREGGAHHRRDRRARRRDHQPEGA